MCSSASWASTPLPSMTRAGITTFIFAILCADRAISRSGRENTARVERLNLGSTKKFNMSAVASPAGTTPGSGQRHYPRGFADASHRKHGARPGLVSTPAAAVFSSRFCHLFWSNRSGLHVWTNGCQIPRTKQHTLLFGISESLSFSCFTLGLSPMRMARVYLPMPCPSLRSACAPEFWSTSHSLVVPAFFGEDCHKWERVRSNTKWDSILSR